jgi:crotonobetainyl-CoA:carnitine CoA-transferase CaiB-like acyl-CoA transferase
MLNGLLVLDLSRVLAGPYGTQLLADLGARVVKVEAPRGDDTRGWGPPFAGDQSGYFLSVNRGKESVAVDLKHPDGAELVRRLAARADVLVENFKVGDLARYRLDPASLAEVNPGLIYASITGYGSGGPRAHEPGYDAALQAITGLMAMTGEPDGGPVKLGVAWIDVLTGLHAAVAILAALHERARTGVGRHLELSLFEVGLASMVNQAQGALLTGEAPRRLGSAHPSIVPYQAFETADAPIMLAVGNDDQFARAAAVLGAPAWAEDPRFATNTARVEHREVLVPLVQERLARQPRDAWLARFRDAGVSATPVLSLPEALADVQAQALGTVGRYRHPSAGEVAYVRSPLRHAAPMRAEPGAEPDAPARAGAAPAVPPPRLGADARAVLNELLGASHEEVDDLIARGVVAVPDDGVTWGGRRAP